MVKAIAKANMLDTEYMVAHCFGADREARNDAITDAGDRFRASITSLMALPMSWNAPGAQLLDCRD